MEQKTNLLLGISLQHYIRNMSVDIVNKCS